MDRPFGETVDSARRLIPSGFAGDFCRPCLLKSKRPAPDKRPSGPRAFSDARFIVRTDFHPAAAEIRWGQKVNPKNLWK